MKQGLVRTLYNFCKSLIGWTLHMIMCVLLCYPVSIHMSQLQATGRPISSLKDTLSIKDEKSVKACRSLCLSVLQSHYKSPAHIVKISTLHHNFLIHYRRDFSHILHICTSPQVDSLSGLDLSYYFL